VNKRYFGTDGIRGRVGEAPITPEFMLRLGWAAGKVLGQGDQGSILVGKDTRISGYMFESALEAGLSSAGMDVSLLGPMPTPAIAYLTRTFHASAGIVISASHNPYYDNGIKFFNGSGTKLDDELELMIESHLDKTMTVVESNQIGKVSRIDDAAGRYIEFCKSCFLKDRDLKNLKIILDCANGATYHVAPSVFREMGAEVIETGVNPDGLNINQQSGSTHTDALCKAVIAAKADLGIAFDGDGDRVIMVDHCGEVVDGDEMLLIIAAARKKRGILSGGVVGTQMSNLGMELALADMKIPFVRAAVGDRYVLAELVKRNWKVGGESSGHLLCLDLNTTGDGIVSSLQVISALLDAETDLHHLKQNMRKFPQCMVNVACKNGYTETEDIKMAVIETEHRLQGKGRVLLRPSGTEPLVRVMIEGEDQSEVHELADELAKVVAESVN
jgi:phosphoglucosamine mutase